jgi:transposase, IS30 family
MEPQKSNTHPRMGKHLNRDERIQIEVLVKSKRPLSEIAPLLGRNVRTIQREIRRGEVEHLNSELIRFTVYSSDRGQTVHDLNATAKGPQLKLGAHYQAAKFIRWQIVDQKFSPAVVSQRMKTEYPQCAVSTKTIYSYIDQGLIEGVANESLWEKRKRHKNGRKTLRRTAKRAAPPGHGIADRPLEVAGRETFGHWEIDLVVSGKGTGKGALLTLVERKTRRSIIRKIKDKTQTSVIKAVNGIERTMGQKAFRSIFKSITADNGSEFLDIEAIEASVFGTQRRTHIYYAHPFASWERGSNENFNRMIRRFIAKGRDISAFSRECIQQIEDWINTYPRKILDFQTAEERYIEELAA